MKKYIVSIALLCILQTVTTHMPHDAKIYVAGHNGLVGSAIIRELEKNNYTTSAIVSSFVLSSKFGYSQVQA